jgi:AraC family transcriptional activator of tynA and feaB
MERMSLSSAGGSAKSRCSKTRPSSSEVKVWDAGNYPPREAFAAFREGICSAFMPWTFEIDSEQTFKGRIESVPIENGAIARAHSVPLRGKRTQGNIADSAMDCYMVAYAIFGNFSVEQKGRISVATSGDLLVYDAMRPTLSLRDCRCASRSALGLVIPKSRFSHIRNSEDIFSNLVIQKTRLMQALANTLNFIAANIHTASREEHEALFDACVSLLPVAARCRSYDANIAGYTGEKQVLNEIMAVAEQDMQSPDLSAVKVAGRLGISDRYVHKLFAERGTTFSSYVTGRRLENIHADLVSSASRALPISAIAYKWGFNDLSTFNRAFKNKFGRPPSRVRAEFG